MELMPALFRCRYAGSCDGYRKDNVTCKSRDAENGFCGKYKEVESRNRD